MIIPIIVLAVVFLFIAVRQFGTIKLQIWQIMLSGALVVLFTGQISITDALLSINPDVMLFLFGMFVIGVAFEESGFLSDISFKMFRKVKNGNQLIFTVIFGMGFASAILMNDTIAIIGTPMMLLLAKNYNIDPKVLLLALAFAITTGSVMSPIGNPQNLLIATEGNIENPFLTFASYLLIPTIINLLVVSLFLKLFFKKSLAASLIQNRYNPVRDRNLYRLSTFSLLLLIFLISLKIILAFTSYNMDLKLVYIALLASVPIIVLSGKRVTIIKKVDWHTLVFFAAMFVLMKSVWDTGFFQASIDVMNIDVLMIPMILGMGVIISQFISNVPLVSLYIPMLIHTGASTKELMALAAGSTIAGNLLIFGAASNVIIIQNAEKKQGLTIGFFEFFKIGAPITIVNIVIYWSFFLLI